MLPRYLNRLRDRLILLHWCLQAKRQRSMKDFIASSGAVGKASATPAATPPSTTPAATPHSATPAGECPRSGKPPRPRPPVSVETVRMWEERFKWMEVLEHEVQLSSILKSPYYALLLDSSSDVGGEDHLLFYVQ